MPLRAPCPLLDQGGGGLPTPLRRVRICLMKVKKTALIVCNNEKKYWITQKQFWNMVREGVVVQTGDFPLTGRFRGRDDQLLITLQHTVLNKATPHHTHEVLSSARLKKTKR